MKKILFAVLICLLVTVSSCNQSNDKQLKPIIKDNQLAEEMVIDPISYSNFSTLFSNGQYEFRDLSNIHRIFLSMKVDEEKKVEIPTFYVRKLYETHWGLREERLAENITFSENGYFAYSGEDSMNGDYTFSDGIIYNYVACNQDMVILKNKFNAHVIENVYDQNSPDFAKSIDYEYEIGYEISENRFGYVLHTQYQYEKDGNHYVIGSKLLNKKIEPNSKGVQYINQHSTLDIPLGCLANHVTNLDQFELLNDQLTNNKRLHYGSYDYEFSKFIVGENVDNYYEIKHKISYCEDEYLTAIKLYPSDGNPNICGVHPNMNLLEAKNSLIHQGFIYQKKSVGLTADSQDKQVFDIHIFKMDNVAIIIEELNYQNGHFVFGLVDQNQPVKLHIIAYIDGRVSSYFKSI